MEAEIIRGNEVSRRVKDELSEEVKTLKSSGIEPGLAVVLVGDDPASAIYVRSKGKACNEVGIFTETLRLDASTSEEELVSLIANLNADKRFHGILVQLPLPGHINETTILETVDPVKDVDCFHPVNVGRLVAGRPYVLPCTPAGIMELLHSYDVDPEGKHAVVLGRSNIVGKPMANMLMQKAKNANATVTIVHSRTRDIPSYTRNADILIAAIGQSEFIKADMVKEGVVVIDVGMNRVPADNEKGYRLTGDVDFAGVSQKAAKITPVPGGVGPMTIAMLLKNTVAAAKYQNQ
jgi:methylenetetrahydrofolate dehydrogenase (NADP+)/methenyltetrahydrofolate cyclohydrolase